ncbi:BrxE family protein [Actinoplanes flavus]|uniref:BrxE family protein n=1 Tax=Actinoplanes flavus TaxID=2820290 RepID=A0ABS3UL29_9ACTN|nr:BrxE family protein [Actinoplanes flavus]MBO3739489.1 BrxE family protein [Actinoplanes flavus]
MDNLLRLRLVVARYGEMDTARWWNTTGLLGSYGTAVLRRGFPRTHRFAQARSVFSVAAHRCEEIFNPPACVTLWRLPTSVEEEFEARWEHWLDNAGAWIPFFQRLEKLGGSSADLASILRSFDLVTEDDLERCTRLRRSAEGRAVALPWIFSGQAEELRLLALGFTRGEPGAPAVPYARSAEA